MGLFSGSKKVFVASSVYNLAGEEDTRTSYMKATVVRNVLTNGGNGSLGAGIVQAHLNGPGIALRSFYRWAKNNYTVLGLPQARISAAAIVNENVLIPYLPRPEGEEVVMQGSEIGKADFINWVEKYLIENNYTAYNTNWLADIDNNTNVITITYENGTKQQITPTNFDKNANYIFAIYNSFSTASMGPVTTETVVDVSSEDEFPEQDDYIKNYDNQENETVTLHDKKTVSISYDDGSTEPDQVTNTDSTVTYRRREGKYTQTSFYPPEESGNGVVQNGAYYYRYLYRVANITTDTATETSSEELPDGRIKTTTVKTETDKFAIRTYYQIDKQTFKDVANRPLRVFLYKIGSGIGPLDAMIEPPVSGGQFYPIIPLRIENRFLSNDYYSTVYPQVKKAIRKAFNSRKATYEEIIKKMETSESLGDIDYAFAVFGVSLNVKENACREYLYRYFKNLMATQTYGKVHDDAYQADYTRWLAAWKRYNDYLEGKLDPPPREAPERPTWFPQRMWNTINIASNDSVGINYNITLNWSMIHEVTGTGKAKPDAKKGDIWFQIMADETPPLFIQYSGDDSQNYVNYRISVVRLYWQDENNRYRYLLIKGLTHINYVYDGKFVQIQGSDALRDPEESGFIIPMHYDTFRSMSLVSSTQMSTACCFLVLNSYEVKKTKWYQSGFFRIFLVFVFAIVSAVFTAGGGFGILGSNLALGASLGYTGVTAAIVGSLTNAIVAMVISSVIQMFSQALGGKFGAILGAVIGFIVMNVASSFLSSGSFSFNWANLMKADNLLKLTDAAIGGYSKMLQADIADMQLEGQGVMENFEKEQKRIKDLYAQNIGYANENIDPMWLVNVRQYFMESGDTFLSRTLMTGSDIADMSHSLLTDFAELTLKLPTAYS